MFADGAGNVAAWCDGDTAANATLQATIGKVTLSLHCVITPTGDYGLALNRTMDGVNWNKLADVALCVAPEVHELPLADGYTNLGCKYFRTQENVVSFAGEIERKSGFHQDEAFAVLPEGFRPDHAIVVPALLYPSFTPASIIIKSNGEICETITASDKSLYMQATFVAG